MLQNEDVEVIELTLDLVDVFDVDALDILANVVLFLLFAEESIEHNEELDMVLAVASLEQRSTSIWKKIKNDVYF